MTDPAPRTATHSLQLPDGRVLHFDGTTPEGRELIASAAATGRPATEIGQQEAVEIGRRQRVARDQRRLETVSEANPILGAGVQMGAAGLGMADAATLGIPRLFASDQTRDRLEAIQRTAPGAHTAGMLATDLGVGALTGGAASSVSRAVAGRLGAVGVSPGLAAMAGTAATTATEGAAAGLAAAITDANIRDVELEGEQVFGNMLMGGVLGLATGLVPGALQGRMLRAEGRAGREALESLQEAGMARAVTDGDVPRVRDLRDMDITAPESQGLIARMAELSPAVNVNPEAQRAIRVIAADPDAAMNVPLFRQRAQINAQQMSSAMRSIREAADIVDNAASRQALLREAAQSADPAVLAGGQSVVRQQRQVLQEVSPTALTEEGTRYLRRVDQALEALEDAQGGDLVAGIDRVLEDTAASVSDGVASSTIASVRESLDSVLEQAVPGSRAVREARAEYAAASADLRRFGRDTTQGFRFEAGSLEREAAGFGAGRANLDTFARWYRAADDLLEVSGASGSPALRNLAEAQEGLAELLRQGEQIGAINYLQGLEGQSGGLQAAIGNKAGYLAAGAIGGTIGGPLGAAGGVAMAAFGHPVGAIRTIHGIRRMLGRSAARTQSGLQAVRRSMISPRMVRATSAGSRAVPRVAAQLRSRETRDREYDRVVGIIRDLAGNPEALLERVSTMTEGVHAVLPGVSAGIDEAAVRAVYHLGENLPPASLPSLFGSPRRPSTMEQEDLIRRIEAIEDPISLLDKTANGTLTRQHVEAVAAVYPQMLNAMRAEVAGLMAELDKLPPYQMRIHLSTLLGTPLDSTAQPQFIFQMQQTYAQTTEQNAVQLGRGPSATMSVRVSNDTMSRAASVTHRI